MDHERLDNQERIDDLGELDLHKMGLGWLGQ